MITDYQFLRILAVFRQLQKEFEKAGVFSGQISQAKAFQMYGRVRVERWRKQGNLNPVKQNSRVYYNMDELTNLSSKYEYEKQN